MDTYNTQEIVQKLIGDIEPVGETHVDEYRYKNLKAMTELLDALIFEVWKVSGYKGQYSYSMRKSGEFADKWLQETKEFIEDGC